MSPAAPTNIAGEKAASQWEKALARLILPIAVVVVVAIGCIVAAVLTAAHRAEEIAFGSERELVKEAIADRGEQVRWLVESIATNGRAPLMIRDKYDPQWVERRVGQRLEGFFKHDIVAIADADGAIKYASSRASAFDLSAIDLAAELAPVSERLRGGAATPPVDGVTATTDTPPATIQRSAVLIRRFINRPALIAGALVGSEGDFAGGRTDSPIIYSVKFIDADLLAELGERLKLSGLKLADDFAAAPEQQVVGLADTDGATIARLAWTPAHAGAKIVTDALPFLAVVLAGFAVLGYLVFRYMRRAGAALTAGEQRLRHLALHDPVSGLPNRIYFGERLEAVIGEVRQGGPTAAVFYIDLDHFKDVNDTLGHPVGDALILSVTQRLSHIVRGDDLVARLGGDEFAIITSCASDSYSLQAIAGRIITSLCAPYAINGHNIMIGASIGIAVIDRRAIGAADILRYADMALYRAKNEGRNRACVYDAAMDADLSSRKLLEGDLLHAIKNDELRAAYQPIVNASGDTVIGVEALARWTHPVHGEIPPSRFIPIAEHSGLIIELGEWMLRRACLDGRDWPGLTIAVNVSPLQFRRSEFVDLVERILHETDFDPGRLELELTESTLLGNLETAEMSMLRLKAIGVRFALDDFGTGYSSLLYLRRFPFDKLKIDASFVRSIEKAPDAAAIVHAVVSLGRGLGMKVTAEGVETAEQHLFLRAAGVHSMQGFRFGMPGTASEISVRLDSPDDYRVGSPDLEIALAS